MKKATATRFSVSLPPALLDQLDEMTHEKGYDNRSLAIADMIRAQLVEHRQRNDAGEIAGTITLVYDHHKPHLQASLTDIQHDHHDAILSTVHVHLDHHNCLEVLIVRGQARPTWLRENLDVLEHGGGTSLEELMSLSSTSGQSDAKVRLWYAQSYSVVRFLIRTQTKSAFFNFSRNLREGRPVPEALYRAYGMPYNRLKALEYAWRYEITTHRLSHISGAAPRRKSLIASADTPRLAR